METWHVLEPRTAANMRELTWTREELQAYSIGDNKQDANRTVDIKGKAPLSSKWYRNAHKASSKARRKMMIGFGIYRPGSREMSWFSDSSSRNSTETNRPECPSEEALPQMAMWLYPPTHRASALSTISAEKVQRHCTSWERRAKSLALLQRSLRILFLYACSCGITA